MKRFMSSGQFHHLPSKQSNKLVKMLRALHQATTSHLVVSVFVAMRLIPMSRPDSEKYMRRDRERATRIRRENVGDPQPQDFGPGSSVRIRLPMLIVLMVWMSPSERELTEKLICPSLSTPVSRPHQFFHVTIVPWR
jgi:hypothetical protein